MSTLQNLPELNILPNRKRDIGSKTPTLTTHTHLYNDPDQKKAETLDLSRTTGNTLEIPDIGQQQRPKSAIRLTKSPTGSTSSYKSSSITGPQETQESMTFAISEIANKVSKSTFSGEEHEEEESTAQFEPPKPKTFKEPNDDKRTQAYQTAISIANSKPNHSPLSVNQTGGWKAVVQKIQNQGSRNMTNQQAQPERVSTPAHPSSKGITMSKGLSSLIEACNVKNTTNFVKVSFQQQLNIPPKSPIRPSGGFVQNISLMSSIGQLNKTDQVSKDLMKEPVGMERLNKTTPVPSFKDYLQKYKGSTSATTNPMKQSAETVKFLQTPLNIKTNFEIPGKRVAEVNTDSNRLAIEEDQNKALENVKVTPNRRSDDNLKENKGLMTAEFKTNTEKIVNTPHPLKQSFGHQTIISTTFKSPKFQIINQIAMPSSTDKEKAQANLKGYMNVKGSSTRKTHLVPELPIISEVPEINLKAKKIVNQYKQDRQSAKSSQNSARFDQLEIGSESSASQDKSETDESEGEDDSNETSESIGQGRALLNQVQQNQIVRKIEFTKPRIPERKNDTQVSSEVLECEESEEGDEEGTSSSGSYYEVEEDSSEAGVETQKVEKSRSACIDDTFKEHIINNSQSKAESEYEEEGNWDYEGGGGSSQYQLTEDEFESPEGRQVQPYQIEAGREKSQQLNQRLYRSDVGDRVKQMGRNRVHNAQVYEEEVLRNRAMNGNMSNFDEQRDGFFKHNTMSSTDLILKKYSEIEYRVWDLKGKQWMFDKEVRILQVSMKSLNERIDSLFDLAEGKPSKKDVVLSLTSSELNQIFEDNSQY